MSWILISVRMKIKSFCFHMRLNIASFRCGFHSLITEPVSEIELVPSFRLFGLIRDEFTILPLFNIIDGPSFYFFEQMIYFLWKPLFGLRFMFCNFVQKVKPFLQKIFSFLFSLLLLSILLTKMSTLSLTLVTFHF